MNDKWLTTQMAMLASVPAKEVVLVWSERDKCFGNATFETVLRSLQSRDMGISHWQRVLNPQGYRVMDHG